MKCVAIKDVKQFEIKDIEEPKKEDNKVIIEVIKTGICGSDIHYWDLGEPKGLVMGHEFCGRVIDPANRDDLKVGDRITALPISPCGSCEACLSDNPQYCKETWTYAAGLSLENPGGLAPKLSVRSDMVIKVPNGVSDEEAAMVEPAAVGLHAVNLANIKKGDNVLVIGAGIIGLVSAMFAKKAGANIVAISETNRKRIEKGIAINAADEFIYAEDLNKYNEFDVVIECCGNASAVSSALMIVKPGGTVVLVGVATGPITIPTVLAVMKELTVKGAIAYTKDEFKTCLDLMENKEIDVLKFLSETVSLSAVQSAYEKLTSGDSDAIKILVDPNRL